MLGCRGTTLKKISDQALMCMGTVQHRMSSQVRASRESKAFINRAGERIALEVDGPSHFAANTLAPGGAMLARHRLLAARGWVVISVPYYIWNRLNDAGRGAWLMQARPHCLMLPASHWRCFRRIRAICMRCAKLTAMFDCKRAQLC